MSRLARLAVIGTAASMLGGCGHYASYGRHRDGPSTVGVLVAGAVVGAAIVASSRPRRVYVRETTTYYVSTPPAFVLTPPPPDGPVRFDVQQARARLSRVDLSDCRAFLPAGYGHAKVTFNPDGHVSRIVVDQPADLPPEVVQCIGERMGRTTVTPYNGSLVAVGASFYLP